MTFLGEFVMERRSGTDAPRAAPALPAPVAAALALGLALALGAGGAAAQRVCSNTPTGTQTIDCTRGDANDIDIDAHDVAISTTAQTGFGVYARHTGSGDVNVALTGGSVTTTGTQAYGIIGWHVGASGAVDIDLKNVVIKTGGFNAFGVVGVHQGAGTVAVNVDIEGGVVETTGYPSHAVHALQAGPGDVALGLKDATVRTTNTRTAHGVFAQHRGATGNLRLDVQGGSVETFGLHSFGVFGRAVDTPGGVEVSVADASVTTRGRLARAVAGRHRGAGAVTVDVSGDTAVTAEGEGGIGVEAFSGGGGAVEIAVGADVAIEAPFANGIVGRQTVAPGRQITAPGRIVVTHRGNVRARNVGVFAWDDPMISSTFGDGESAAETAGDEPAIHVTSSGDVTVGENVMDAYIRAAVAARPLSPTDRFSWTAGVEPTDPGARRADEAAVEILGLSHAGIRAMALSHLAVVDHIREGDVDPDIVASVATITAIAENTRTPQQRETLAMQQETLATQRMLSPAEWTVLAAALTGGDLKTALATLPVAYTDAWKDEVRRRAAALTGGDLETALAALPAAYTDAWKDEVRRLAAGYNAGDIQVDVTGGTITSDGDGVDARYVLAHDRNGAIAVTVAAGATVSGVRGRHGVHVGGAGLAAGNGGLRDQTVTVNGAVKGGAVKGGTGAGVHLAGGGTVTVGETGRVGATSGMAVLSDGPGDLSVTVERKGEITGDIRAQGGGDLTLDVKEGGKVTGTVHDPASPLTVRGSIGRLLYANGGTVTVAATGRLTGVEAEGRTEAIRSEAGDLGVTVAAMGRVTGDLRALGGGDLDATISGTVEGDLLAQGGGALTVDVQEGGEVTGTVHDPAGPLTVHGSIGRLLYANGGTVTVADTGRLTGVEVEGRTEAIRSEAGDLSVTVAGKGKVTGDLRALGGGTLTLNLVEGGEVNGTIQDPAGDTFTVVGSIGRLLYASGGTVTVAATGLLTGVEVEGRREAIRSEAGDLSVTISGRVEGDVVGRGAGEHTVTVAEGGVVTGTIHLSASTVGVDGTAGRVRFDKGGTVTVGRAGRLTGIEGVALRSEAGDLAVTVAEMGTVTGDIRGLGAGGLSAMVAGTVTGDVIEEGAGDLDATISGTVEGNVFGRGTGEHTVTVSNGGTVTGTIHLAASPVTVHGTAGRVRFDEGGTVTVGGTGRITGIEVEDGREAEAIRSEAGDLKVTLHERAGETGPQATDRIDGTIRNDPKGSLELCYVPAGGGEECASGPAPTVPQGAWDVGLRPEGGGVYRLESVYAPRSRLYEALPSVLLGLNAPVRYEERMAAARAEQGGWARVETVHGKWKADASASQKLSGVELEYDHRRHGLQAGMDVAAGEDGLFGVSLHHRRGSADVSKGGKVELSGHGVGVSGAWGRDGVYVDVQAEATWYEADFTSSLRGALEQDVSGHGYALGVEAGRRIASGWAGMVLTPRAGLVHSRVFVGDFTDRVGTQVSVEDGRSLKGRAGMVVEVKPQWWARGSRVFGSVDVEREFSKDRKVRVSGTELRSEADATWLRFGLNGSHVLDDGRWTVAGRVGYATSGGSHELGGGLHLKMRF